MSRYNMTGSRGVTTWVQIPAQTLFLASDFKKDFSILKSSNKCLMDFKRTSQKEVRTTLKSWKVGLYSLATVWWKYVNQIPLPDIPLCISRTNSWNETDLISIG